MKSYVTSYNGLFGRQVGDAPAVQRIEIPMTAVTWEKP